jgi:type IV secretion system protein VirB9
MNHKKMTLIGLLLLGFTVIHPAFADQTPQDGVIDPRVKTAAYHDHDVYRLNGHYGFTTLIEFGPHEIIETAEIGDSDAWQTVKTSHPNLLLIKPKLQNADTNMNVLTNQHLYSFRLVATKATSADADDLVFHLHFTYPDDKDAGLTNYTWPEQPVANSSPAFDPKTLNFKYSYSGAKSLQPERVFDNGKYTYFQFKTLDSTPAVFLVDEKGNESIVNFTTQGSYLVVQRTGRQFTLRDGEISTCIFNEAYVRPTGKQSTPTPLNTIKPKKTAAKKSGNSPSLFSMDWFNKLTPVPANNVTYNQ